MQINFLKLFHWKSLDLPYHSAIIFGNVEGGITEPKEFRNLCGHLFACDANL